MSFFKYENRCDERKPRVHNHHQECDAPSVKCLNKLIYLIIKSRICSENHLISPSTQKNKGHKKKKERIEGFAIKGVANSYCVMRLIHHELVQYKIRDKKRREVSASLLFLYKNNKMNETSTARFIHGPTEPPSWLTLFYKRLRIDSTSLCNSFTPPLNPNYNYTKLPLIELHSYSILVPTYLPR